MYTAFQVKRQRRAFEVMLGVKIPMAFDFEKGSLEKQTRFEFHRSPASFIRAARKSLKEIVSVTNFTFSNEALDLIEKKSFEWKLGGEFQRLQNPYFRYLTIVLTYVYTGETKIFSVLLRTTEIQKLIDIIEDYWSE